MPSSKPATCWSGSINGDVTHVFGMKLQSMWRALCVMAACLMMAGCGPGNRARTSSAAVEAMKYLDGQDGVVWHEVDGNNVFIGFTEPPPKEWRQLLEDAAETGSHVTKAEFIAAAIKGDQNGWRKFADSNTIGAATARDGQIVK